MGKIKKQIYIILLSILVYFALTYFNNKVISKKDYDLAYIVTEELKRGDIVTSDKISVIKISKDVQNSNIRYNYSPLEKISNYDLVKGQIILEDMLVNKDEYLKPDAENEIISIKLNSSDDAASYQIEKGSIVNIYCTAKVSQISSIVQNNNLETIYANDSDGYATLKLIDNIKIIEIYDKQRKQVR